MKKTLLLLFLILFSVSSLVAQTTFYVATDGDDSNSGTEASPFATFSKAVSEMAAGDICVIKGGVYEEELIINKNGTVGNYLTFKAAAGADVEIRATKALNGWQLHNGNIYKTSVDMQVKDGDNGRFRAVYHNENYMDLARWPNNTDNNRWTVDCHPVDDGDGNHFVVSGIQNIDWTGGLVYYFGAHSGASWTRTITSSSSTRIDFTAVDTSKWPFSTHNPQTWRNYPGNNRGQLFLFNKLEALDHAREWYYDNSAKLLYLQTADGTIPADGTVEYATRKFAAQIQGDYIKLEGINFFGGSIKIHNNADNNELINCSVIHGCEGHDSLTNTSAQVGEAAIEVLGDNTIIKGCIVNHSSVSGIVISGWAADDCTLEGNTISNTDYVGIHASPIRTSGDNMKILKNTIFNTGRDGMYVAGQNCEIAYNDVSASQKINSDSGVFYTVGNNNLKNNEIHHNWFHDATAPSYSHNPSDPGKAAGIYLDNNSKGYTVHHNVVWNVSWSGYQVNWNNTHLDFYHNTIWNAERAMDAWVNGYVQENNKIYNNFSNVGDWFSETANDFDIQDNLITSESPFEDADNQNFMPKAVSSVMDEGRVISGFDKPYKGSAPDIGAYEVGGTRWTAGVNAIEDTGEGDPWSIFDTQFTISATSETCPDKNNGKVTIVADYQENYVFSFDGTDYDFSNEKTLENIDPGTYDLCISLKDGTGSQCFVVEVQEGAHITGKSSLSKKTYSLSIEQGTAPFNVSLNGEFLYQTSSSNLSVTVNQGDLVSVKSSKDCEGEIIETIDFYKSIVAYPNPTSGIFQFDLPVDEGRVFIELYNIHSQLISSKLYVINNGRVNLSLENSPSGIYFAKIINKEPIFVKVIKN
ncbi:right-handed parallel beta-helix repeat-containing protein [Seonamhaeicola maritimus]|uniref:right-handed parallel beta-helix repeat-containing protein n=1 Tax=Seonamhaeicola maritimus TaxID=2591822 RepID=UPI002494F940|nr:right-handed parallel beta-helix repeat-containing protein [Seonamhaeicola maritimus]